MELLLDAAPLTEGFGAPPGALADRLAPFLAACAAVQHAHQRGVIHRDLKPDNILRLRDGTVKVIDFGIARVLDGDRLGHTRDGELLGTLAYMSPEQVEARDTDVRTDVYGLGVVLFELLVGQRPFDVDGLSITAACRTIVEREAPLVRRLCPSLPRELDWIVATALRKAPAERYQSVAELRADLRRMLRHEPVLAAPPGLGYRAAKFVRRHRTGVAAAAAVLAVAAFGFATTATALVRARDAEALERQRRTEAERAGARASAALEFLLSVFEAVHPGKEGRDVKMADALASTARTFDRELAASPTIRAALGRAIGVAFAALGQLPEAEQRLRDSVAVHEACHGDRHVETARVRLDLAGVLVQRGELDEADLLLAKAEQVVERLPDGDPLRLACRVRRGDVQRARGDHDGAITLLRPVVATLQSTRPDERQTLLAANLLAGALHERGELDAAEPLYRAAIDGFAKRGEQRHPEALAATNNLLALLHSRGRRAEMLPLFERLLEIRREVLGERHPDTIGTLSNLGALHYSNGDLDAAANAFAAALAALGPDADDRDRHVQTLLSNLSKLETQRGNYAAAIAHGERALASRREVFGDDHDATLMTMAMLADAYRLDGRVEAAMAMLRDAERLAAAAEPEQPTNLYRALHGIARCHLVRDELAEAEAALQRCAELYEAAEARNAIKGQLPRADELLAEVARRREASGGGGR